MNHDLWDDLDQPPHVSSVQIGPHELSTGDRVRLHPQGRADIMDLALAGKIAVIEAIEHDFEGRIHLAVILEDDPGRDLGLMRQIGHRFFFRPEDVEPLGPGHSAEAEG